MNIRNILVGIFFVLVTNLVFAETKARAVEGISLSAKTGDILRKIEPQLNALNIKGSLPKADLEKR